MPRLIRHGCDIGEKTVTRLHSQNDEGEFCTVNFDAQDDYLLSSYNRLRLVEFNTAFLLRLLLRAAATYEKITNVASDPWVMLARNTQGRYITMTQIENDLVDAIWKPGGPESSNARLCSGSRVEN